MTVNDNFSLFKVNCAFYKTQNNEGSINEICGMKGNNYLCDCLEKKCTRLINGPKIVCLCGSTKFKDEFIDANLDETMKGNIVLTVGWFSHVDKDEFYPSDDEKIMLDELHKRKIDIADEILVINVNDYIGDSTRSEIEYARKKNKVVVFLEEHEE